MNLHGIYRLTVLLLLTGCAKPENQASKDVAALREKLPQLNTPLEYRSNRMYKFKAVELDSNTLITKLSEKSYFTLLGKVFETPDNISILGYSVGDIGTPVIITFDNSGKELSSKVLYENAMTDSVQSRINIVKVLPDRQIVFTDSTIYMREAPGSDSVAVVHRKYRIGNDGLIVPEN